ncbi:DUF2357 domain-containing protein [Cellulomonas sp. PS-H5]|uniref:DUF2357 domain-containing protein n=1 Tax=Cellulomonas sp. PS-H5 TaxID=2820400 RepID=UPI001C4E5345|nr:DUF2357 domain-containing protein [Cellulomonas sp. PS-H5]MBW0252607.1 restriction endonuclease-like protein [Cellulomonas sp. PS-H5]
MYSIASQDEGEGAAGKYARFFEEVEYWFVVRSKRHGARPEILQRDPNLISRRRDVPDTGISAATVVYRRQVGLSDWRFRVDDQELLITIEVFPAKLDYVEDYEALVDEVANVNRTLVLEYFRGTYRVGSLDNSGAGSTLDWAAILRSDIEALSRALHQVNQLPHYGLETVQQWTALHSVRRVTPSAIRAIGRGEGSGEYVDIPGVGPVRSRLHVARPRRTLDTFEHRWLRSRLLSVCLRLRALINVLEDRIATVRARSIHVPPRLIAEADEVRSLLTSVERLTELPVIRAATADVAASLSSIQLLSAIGYGEGYRILSSLDAALNFTEDSSAYSLSDLNELYEMWCFVKLVQLAAEITGASVDLTEVLSIREDGLRVGLVKGSRSAVRIRWDARVATLTYNPEYRMPTGVQRPDIVLEVEGPGVRRGFHVFDAKYRLDASPRYIEQFGGPGAPVDAVNALHRYRDAIRPKEDGERRPVVETGVALFPLSKEEVVNGHGLADSIAEVGIGALPFLPSNFIAVRDWLREVLSA